MVSFDELALTLLSINQKPLVSNIKFFLKEALKAISGSAVEPAGSQLDPVSIAFPFGLYRQKSVFVCYEPGALIGCGVCC